MSYAIWVMSQSRVKVEKTVIGIKKRQVRLREILLKRV